MTEQQIPLLDYPHRDGSLSDEARRRHSILSSREEQPPGDGAAADRPSSTFSDRTQTSQSEGIGDSIPEAVEDTSVLSAHEERGRERDSSDRMLDWAYLQALS